MGALRLFVLSIFTIWLGCGSAQAGMRVALVIGNSAYKNVPQLSNPANDAALVGGMFKKAGFDSVEIKTDLNAVGMRKALREFGGRARDASVAVIYYAGHGIELDGTKFDAKLASFDAWDAIRAKPGRVCPLVCDHGFKADGDQCVKIACRAGYRVNDDNECERVKDKRPVATREDAKNRDAARRQVESTPSRQQASGQFFCNSAGCRPLGKGCKIERADGTDAGAIMAGRTREVCN